MSVNRLLIYSAYSQWHLHTVFEALIGRAARERGVEVLVVTCGGLFSDCDVHWYAAWPRDAVSCRQCAGQGIAIFNAIGIQFEFLQSYVRHDEIADAKGWASSIPRDELLDAQYDGFPLGHWVRSSVNSHLRAATLDTAEVLVERTLRSYLASARLAFAAIEKILERFRPDGVFLVNGRFFSHRLLFELARRRGLRVVTYERGHLQDSFIVFENSTVHDTTYTRALWQRWGDVPLTRPEAEAVIRYLANRRIGVGMSWKPFSPTPQAEERLRAEFGIAGKAVVTAFTSSDDEVASLDGWTGVFTNQEEWLRRCVEWARHHPDVVLVIRGHPHIDDNEHGRNGRSLDLLMELRRSAPANVRVIMPRDPVSSYTLGDLSQVALVYVSTIGVEIAATGKPVVLGGGGHFRGLPFVLTPRDRSHFFELLNSSLQNAPSPDVARYAYRYVYHVMLRPSIQLSSIIEGPRHYGRVRLNLRDPIKGQDPALDFLVDAVLGVRELIPYPTAWQRARNCQEETAVVSAATRHNAIARLATRLSELISHGWR